MTRGIYYVLVLAAVWTTAGNFAWAAFLSIPIVLTWGGVRSFDARAYDRWTNAGLILLADAAIGALSMLGSSASRRVLLACFAGIVILGVFLADRRRATLASVAWFAAIGAVLARPWPGPGHLGPAELAWLPVLLVGAWHVGGLAERLSGGAVPHAPATGELWALFGISEAITRRLDVNDVMRTIVERVGDLVDATSCSILLADSRSPDCLVLASKGHPEAAMLELDLAKYPEVRAALDTRQPVVVDDVEHAPLVAPVRAVLLAKGYRSLLVLPLLHGSELVGALFIKTAQRRSFSPEVLRFCKVAAGLSANALKNSMLYRDVKATGEKMRRLLDASPDLIVATDTGGAIVEFNHGAEELTGLQQAEVIGHGFASVFGDAEGDGPFEIDYERRDGGELRISVVSAPFEDADGRPAGRVWIGRDVTKLRQVERSLAQAERLSSLGEVVAGVAHELNNPLSAVVGYAELLRAQAVDPGQIRDLDRIVQSSMRCRKIVFKLLSFARKHAPEKKLHSLNDCAEKVLDLKSYHLRSSQVETVLEFDQKLPRTCFDFHQIDQVILNLINNAEHAIRARFGSGGGTITVSSGSTGDEVWLEVADDGSGVPESVRERVFDPFFTTKELGQGTGLGLSVSYGLVREHGGRLELRDTPPGSGAVFRLWLPIVEGPAPETAANLDATPVPANLRGCRVLVADDEPTVLEVLGRLLQAEGAQVVLAQDGEEAWQRLEHESFDLVVVDLRMPALSGQELYHRVAVERPELLRRFVFATGDLLREESLQFLETIPNRILTKPLELETVRRVLSQALEAA